MTLSCDAPIDPWVERHVIPFLDMVPDGLRSERLSRKAAAEALRAWIAYDELLLHLNDSRLRPQGVDQNRIFGGLQVAAWPSGRVEAGYLNQFLPGLRGTADRMNHVLSTVLAISF